MHQEKRACLHLGPGCFAVQKCVHKLDLKLVITVMVCAADSVWSAAASNGGATLGI